ncbi:MAG TPA: hypothetical protein GXX57_02615 [Firmicutes bacterium]|nr:hypothetical protein [Bacillota bacterium]
MNRITLWCPAACRQAKAVLALGVLYHGADRLDTPGDLGDKFLGGILWSSEWSVLCLPGCGQWISETKEIKYFHVKGG